MRALYDLELPPLAAELLAQEAGRARAPTRIRLDVRPDGRTTAASRAERGRAAPPARPMPFLLPGGLGAHKWRDRALLEALDAKAGPAAALLVDGDGDVLEATRANLFVDDGDGLVTPPADGRILPGVTRARLIEALGAREAPIPLERLLGAREAFLTSSIALVRPLAISGVAPAGDGSSSASAALAALRAAPARDGLVPLARPG